MDSKTLIKALKVAVREVIKEELTEILTDGLQSTINELTRTKHATKTNIAANAPKTLNEQNRKSKTYFSENKWASVLNSTDPLTEVNANGLVEFKDILQEGMDELRFNSRDAQSFGVQRGSNNSTQQLIEDPETGKVFEIDPIVEKAMTRDYSELMKAIAKKKGN